MNQFVENGLLRHILSNLNVLIYSRDGNNNWFYFSDQCEQYTGYSSDIFFQNHHSWLECILSEDRVQLTQQWQELHNGETTTVEYRFQCADGTVKWFSDSAKAVLDENKKIVRVDGSIRDVTRHKETETELHLVRSAVESANNGMIIVDARKKEMPIIFTNRAFEELTGYERDEVCGKNCRLLQGSDRQQDGIEKIRRAVRDQKKANVVLRNYKKNGDLFYNHIYISPVKNMLGEVTHYIGVQYDVTEKHRLQQKLKTYYEREKYLRTILGIIADLNKMIGTAKNESFLFHNLCQKLMENKHYQYIWVGLMGNGEISKSYSLGQPAISVDKKKQYHENIQSIIMTQPHLTTQLHSRHRNLGYCLVIPMKQMVKKEKLMGQLVIYSHYDHGFMEEEVAMMEDLMMTVSNAIEYQKMDQLMFYHARQAALGELIGNMAHQWRQPINELGLILQDLREAYHYEELNEAYVCQSTESGMELLHQMSATIDDLRRFFTGSQRKESFLLSEVIRQSLALVQPHLNKLSIKVELQELDEIRLFGYSREYAQVVINLLNNSRDALLRQQPSHPQISIFIKKEGSLAIMTIEDNGGGIPENLMDRVFEQYYTTKKDYQGAGLGLYISRMIIENGMGGKISAKNISEGASFRVEVPL
ncbi:PAS domain S-box protein [Anoxynatronum buryatiense]|uniref:histidine kinase n=1 Tax=Anoxynatronum buryatiense TaxID=489973 RepID=A0AA45WT60_9CLOT|nr:PAS domain S-box protein [Anoxynatronum buryatiense]SMP37867.1 PAS domain S-box-containing protein [Anoxynatronum buryatiense]